MIDPAKDQDTVQFIAWNGVRCRVKHLIDFTSYFNCTNTRTCSQSGVLILHVGTPSFSVLVSTLLALPNYRFRKSLITLAALKRCRKEYVGG